MPEWRDWKLFKPTSPLVGVPDNEPSLKALRNCGYVTEGILRSHLVIAGSHHDVVSLSLIPADLG